MHIENVPRSSWKLAIVKKVLRGSDGPVRAAEIKTNSGVTSLSIYLLSPLEVTRRILRKTLRELNSRFHRSKHSEEANELLHALTARPQNVESGNQEPKLTATLLTCGVRSAHAQRDKKSARLHERRHVVALHSLFTRRVSLSVVTVFYSVKRF